MWCLIHLKYADICLIKYSYVSDDIMFMGFKHNCFRKLKPTNYHLKKQIPQPPAYQYEWAGQLYPLNYPEQQKPGLLVMSYNKYAVLIWS